MGSLFAASAAKARPSRTIVDTHVHLFDPARVPYHANAPYNPEPATLEPYATFAADARIDHAIIVHPEPYQDDHRYLQYCFEHEPSRGFFKGTCLFDPNDAVTPARLEALVRKHPGRIVALRIHEMGARGAAPESGGAIKNRDLGSPAMKNTWRKAQQLGLAIQMHLLPHYAPQIGELAAELKGVTVLLDHLGRSGQGSPEDFEGVLRLARYPKVHMKYSGVNYSSKQAYPFTDAKPLVRRIYDAFGPDRIIWGGCGMNMPEFEQQSRVLDVMFDFAPETARSRIRGLNAMRLFFAGG